MTTYTCSRCNGSGSYSFNLIHGTKCYGCNGTGQQRTKPKAPTPKWAVFGRHRETQTWMRLYNVVSSTKAAAIEKARSVYAEASTAWKDTYTLSEARAIKWTDMADQQALTWDDATQATEFATN